MDMNLMQGKQISFKYTPPSIKCRKFMQPVQHFILEGVVSRRFGPVPDFLSVAAVTPGLPRRLGWVNVSHLHPSQSIGGSGSARY
jgi:hypothetical protein